MHLLVREPRLLDEFPIDYTQPIFCDTETCIDEGKTRGGLYGKIRLVQFYQKGWDMAALIDCFFVDLEAVLEKLVDGHLVWHNATYDMSTINLYTPELWLPHDLDDTLYLSRLTFFTKYNFSFYHCLEHAGLSDEKIRSIDKKQNQEYDWSGPLLKRHREYAEYDVTYLCRLYDEVKAAKTMESYELDMFNLKYALEYDRRGIPVNRQKVKNRLLECSTKLEKNLETLPVNPNSSKQCRELLGTSKADRDVLMKLYLEGNQMAGQIREARLLSKERMYLMKYDRPKIYGFHNACGAISGRMACDGGHRFDHENVQQIPRRLLPCLEAPDGWVFVYKDYAGLELRMAVAWTGEPTMERLMREGVDLHSYSGSIIYHKAEEELTKYERMIGKILNFTLVYGAMAPTLQVMLRAWGNVLMELKEVSPLRTAWLDTYEYFKTWHEMHSNHMRVYGYLDITTALGRTVRTYSVPDSLNIPIQGSSAEVTKYSLYLLKTRYPDENLINTIHDSNCLLVREEEADKWVERLNEVMVEAWYYVIKGLAIPDLPMPPEAEYKKTWEF